jgi:hypothetical protein
MATDELAHPGSVFRMIGCWIHDANGGNNVKSRAERNGIEGAYYHELELIGPDPAGGVPEATAREDSDVVGNVFVKRGANEAFAVVRFGGDGTGQSVLDDAQRREEPPVHASPRRPETIRARTWGASRLVPTTSPSRGSGQRSARLRSSMNSLTASCERRFQCTWPVAISRSAVTAGRFFESTSAGAPFMS